MVSMGGEALVRRRQRRRVSSDPSSNQVANEVWLPKHVDCSFGSEQRPDPFYDPQGWVSALHWVFGIPVAVLEQFPRLCFSPWERLNRRTA